MADKRVALDTNVFFHLLNDSQNEGHHIEHLLVALARLEYCLCVDEEGRIEAEYDCRLGPLISNSSDIGIERIILTYWMNTCARVRTKVKAKGDLVRRIESIIPERAEATDRAFVAVAIINDAKLVSNDESHLLGRGSLIRKKTRRWHNGRFAVVSSQDAYRSIVESA